MATPRVTEATPSPVDTLRGIIDQVAVLAQQIGEISKMRKSRKRGTKVGRKAQLIDELVEEVEYALLEDIENAEEAMYRFEEELEG